MSNIFIISDTHFGHENILSFIDENTNPVRTFSDVYEMDALMIDNWNKLVNDNDIVYHLGDVYFGKGYKILPYLKGRKRLILGNHDNPKSEHISKNFERIMMWEKFRDFNCVATHVPVHESALFGIKYNLHGHIHTKKSPTDQHINCCVEVTDYMPRPIEVIMKDLK